MYTGVFILQNIMIMGKAGKKCKMNVMGGNMKSIINGVKRLKNATYKVINRKKFHGGRKSSTRKKIIVSI